MFIIPYLVLAAVALLFLLYLLHDVFRRAGKEENG